MIIVQNAPFEVAMLRFDNGEQITITPGVQYDVDEGTGTYILGMRSYNAEGVLTADFSRIG